MSDHISLCSRTFSYGTVHMLCTEKSLSLSLHESCQVLVEHAQSVAKIRFGTLAKSVFIFKYPNKAQECLRVGRQRKSWKFNLRPSLGSCLPQTPTKIGDTTNNIGRIGREKQSSKCFRVSFANGNRKLINMIFFVPGGQRYESISPRCEQLLR